MNHGNGIFILGPYSWQINVVLQRLPKSHYAPGNNELNYTAILYILTFPLASSASKY